MKTTSIIVLAIGLTLASAAGATAQAVDSKVYLDLNVAGQTHPVTIATTSTFSLFGDTGRTSFSQRVDQGLMFDGSAGYFVRPNFSVGVAVSVFTVSPISAVSVATPDPIAFNSFSVLGASPKLRHTEMGTHINVAYHLRIGDKTAVAIFGGPSIVRLSKEIASASAVNGTTQAAIATQTGTGTGAHGGVDVSYFFKPRLGAGIMVRYMRATVDLPVASGVEVGGAQGGIGLRFRF